MDLKKQNIQFLSSITSNILDWTFNNYPNKIFSTSAFGINGVVLLDFIRKKNKFIPIYFIDTGYHFKETIEIKDHYRKIGFNIIEVTSTVEHSDKLLETVGVDVCCSINKVEPMKKILNSNEGNVWITAVSRDQTSTRINFRYLQQQNNILKICPMLNWKEDEIWQYARDNNLVYNKLYDKGYKSIGCQPCTSIVKKGEDSRAGRWSGLNKDECGIQEEVI